MTHVATTDSPLSPEVHQRNFNVRRVAASGAVALLVNLALFGLGSMADAGWSVGQPYPINLVAVVAATVISFTVGGVATMLLSRWRAGFQRFAAWAGLAVGVLSMVSLLGASDLATGLSLAGMHLVTAGLWFWSVLPREEKR